MFSKGLVERFIFQRLRYNLRQLHMGEGSVANTKPQRTESDLDNSVTSSSAEVTQGEPGAEPAHTILVIIH